MDLTMIKRSGIFQPMTEMDAGQLYKLPAGKPFKVKVTGIRNPQFHRKYFSLLSILYDAFDPQPVFLGGVAAIKDPEKFRSDLLIGIGHCIVVADLNTGTASFKAKSISFAEMDEADFSVLYNSTIDYALQILPTLKQYNRQQIDEWVLRVMDYG